jgi:hypothetical protein
MPVKQPFIITSPDLAATDRDWWFVDPHAGPKMRSSLVAVVFFGWTQRTLNLKLNQIKDEYDIPFQENRGKVAGRLFTLYDVERINRLFLNRGIIDYRKFYGATQILKAMGANHNLI